MDHMEVGWGQWFCDKVGLPEGVLAPLTKRVKNIAYFITHSGLYSYQVMPFGWRNVPVRSQPVINLIMHDLGGCVVYLDDLAVLADSWQEHLD